MSMKPRSERGVTVCPIPNVDGSFGQCGTDCEWYVEENNDEYSGCAIPKLYSNLTSVLFELKARRGK